MENTNIKTNSMIDSRLDEIIKGQNELLKQLQYLAKFITDKNVTYSK